jgi:hypothetical protein
MTKMLWKSDHEFNQQTLITPVPMDLEDARWAATFGRYFHKDP